MNSCFSSTFKDEDKLLIFTCPIIPSLINNYCHLTLNKNKILGLHLLSHKKGYSKEWYGDKGYESIKSRIISIQVFI